MLSPSTSFRVLDDAVKSAAHGGRSTVVYARPTLVEDPGAPSQVDVVLREEPPLHSRNVRNLIVRARARLRLRLVPDARASQLSSSSVPLWPLSQRLTLEMHDSILARADLDAGAALRLCTWLDRASSLALLDSVFDADETLMVRGRVSYRSESGPRWVEMEAPLSELLVGSLLEDRVSLLVESDGELRPISRRVVSRASRTTRRQSMEPAIVRTTAVPMSVAHNLRPVVSNAHPAHAFAALPSGKALSHVALSDIVLTPLREAIPLVDPIDAPYWRDLHASHKSWWAPDFELVPPDRNDSAADSSFGFEFRREGTTAEGDAALRGHVELQVRSVQSESTKDALTVAGRLADAAPVPIDGLAAQLVIPFVDSDTGEVRTHRVDATIAEQRGETYTLTTELFGHWVRLAYSSFANPGFQPLPIQVSIMYRFRGAFPLRESSQIPSFGGKVSSFPLLASAISRGSRGLRLAREGLAVHAAGHHVATFVKEKPSSRPVATTGIVAPVTNGSLALRPNLTVAEVDPVEYGRRSFARQSRVTVSVPCETHGHLYLDATDDPPAAVGCAEYWELGAVRYDLYDPIPELTSDRFRVERAIQSPGRFLVRPSSYRLGRRAADDPQGPYAPLVFLYAHLSANAADATRVVLDATLLPDVTPAELATLAERLSSDGTPVAELQFPTELDHEDVEWSWNIGALGDLHVTTMITPGGGVQVTISSSVEDWGLLRSMLETGGLTGQGKVLLADGSEVLVAMRLDLGHLVGPLGTGAVTAERIDDAVQLTNNSESPMAIDSCILADPGFARLPVGLTLASGESVRVPTSAEADRVIPDYAPVVGASISLDEVRSYIENIETKITFVNLINLDNHGLARLDVVSRIEGLGADRRVALDDTNDIAEATFVLPLTRYLTNPPLEYRTIAVSPSGAETPSPWQTWDIGEDGVVISLVWQDT